MRAETVLRRRGSLPCAGQETLLDFFRAQLSAGKLRERGGKLFHLPHWQQKAQRHRRAVVARLDTALVIFNKQLHTLELETEAEARARIDEMKKKYYDARHNCWHCQARPSPPQGSDGMSLRRKIYEVIEVADKDDRDSLIYDRFMLVCIAASIVPLCFKETNALFIWLDRATVTVFIVDYLLRWWTADLKYEKSGKWAFLRYPFSFFGIVDLLSILPSLTMLSSGFKLFRLFRLNKALKALKFLRYSHSFELILNVIKRERRALAAVCVLAVSLVLKKTAMGMYVQAVGINKKASRIAGLNSRRIIFMCYFLCGVCAAIAGIVNSSRITSADSNNIGLNMG